MTYLACGPYVGSVESEILVFRPYVYWLKLVLKPDVTIVSSHYNREFFYKGCEFIPIFDDLSRNEFNQIGVTNLTITSQDYTMMVKKFKHTIQEKFRPSKNQIVYYTLPYIKNPWIPIYKRYYTKFDTSDIKVNQIVYIPHNTEKQSVTGDVYNLLKTRYNNIVCCGDMKTHLPEYNILLKDPTYFQNVYTNMVNLISNSKYVITPLSHWSLIADIQGVPCFSWGKNNYNMLSKGTKVVGIRDIHPNMLLTMIENWIGRN